MEVGKRNRAAAILAAVAIVLLAPAAAFAAPPEATTDPATNVKFTSATLNGTANAGGSATYFFQYGPTPSYGSSTPQPAAPVTSQNVNATVNNLQSGVTYHFRLCVDDPYAPGNQPSCGQDMTFTTPLPGAVATTGDATSVTNMSAVLNGVANTTEPNSQWFFEYGRTTSYGSRTQAHTIGAGITVLSSLVRGLAPGTRYHFRLVVLEGTSVLTGNDRTFTTSNFGTLSLAKHKLRVSHRRVRIPLRCKGPRGGVCRGTLRITVGKRACAGGHFSLRTGQRRTLKKTVRGRCLARLARHHRLRARFRATLAGPQGQLKARVRLVE